MKMLSSCLPAVVCTGLFLLIACSAPITPINVDGEGIALKGYDPVAYFTLSRPVQGQKEFQFEWHGAKWLFSNLEHLTLFQGAPEKYTPQYGGY